MKFSRRTFLQTATATIAARTFAAEARTALVGSQLFGWGQYFQREGKTPMDMARERNQIRAVELLSL